MLTFVIRSFCAGHMKEKIMSYCTMSHWDCTEWTDEMEAMAKDKYVPLIMAVGASSVKMLRTGDLSFVVLSEYADKAAADAAQAKIAEIRAGAADEMPMKMASVTAGAVFASS